VNADLPPIVPAGQPSDKRAYHHLLAAQLIALISTGVATVALALLAYEQVGADAGAVLGTALSIRMLTYVALAPIAAAVTERLPRRGLLVGLDITRAAVALPLPFVTREWEIYVLIFIFQAASAAFVPAVQATYPDLLPDEKDYTRALAKTRLAYELENVVSPVVAAGLLMVLGFADLFIGTAIGFLASAVLILRVRLPYRPQRGKAGTGERPADSARRRMARGLRFFWATPRLRGLLAVNLAAAAAVAMVMVNTVVLVQASLTLSERATGIALGAFGAGAVVCALALPWFLEHIADRTAMLAGAVLVTAGLMIGTTAPNYHVLLVLWLGLGFGAALAQLPAGRVLRRSCEPEDRPTLYAAHFSLTYACLLITYPLAGWLGAATGLRTACSVLGVLAAAATLVAVRFWPVDDRSGIARDA
jgi:predicted MFS family arabinose efflux permease